jgi:hypothetical protein
MLDDEWPAARARLRAWLASDAAAERARAHGLLPA